MFSLTPESLVTRDSLKTYELPRTLPYWENDLKPERSNWMPIHHYELTTTTLESLESNDFEILDEMYTQFAKGHGLIGAVEVKPKEVNFLDDVGMTYCFVFKHANNGTLAPEFMMAGKVSVCANGCVFGKIYNSVKRRHSDRYTVQERVLEGVDLFNKQLSSAAENVKELQEKDVSLEEGNHLIMNAGHSKIIPSNMVLKTSSEWSNPRHTEFKERNAWSLYNAFTEACKSRPGHLQLDTCTRSKTFIENYLEQRLCV